MQPNQETESQRLKRELQHVEQAIKKKQLLLDKYDQLEATLQNVSQEIDNHQKLAHRKHDHRQEDEKGSQKIIEKNGLLAELKLKKKELDHLLDQFENLTEESVLNLRKKLIDSILDEKIHLRASYLSIQKDLNQNLELYHQLLPIQEHLGKIIGKVTFAYDVRQKVKRQWLLSYLIGKNPSVVITEELKNAESEAIQLIERIERDLQQTIPFDMIELYQSLLKYLTTFKVECVQPWTFVKLDLLLKQALTNFQLFEEKVHEKKEILHGVIEKLEKAFNDWLNEHSE